MSRVDLNGIGQLTHVTYYLSQATATAIQDDTTKITNQVLAITGNVEVGYGTAGDRIEGFASLAEPFDTTKEKYVVSLYINGFFTDIHATGLALKDYVSCDGNGGLQKSTEKTNAQVVELDADKETVTIHLR